MATATEETPAAPQPNIILSKEFHVIDADSVLAFVNTDLMKVTLDLYRIYTVKSEHLVQEELAQVRIPISSAIALAESLAHLKQKVKPEDVEQQQEPQEESKLKEAIKEGIKKK